MPRPTRRRQAWLRHPVGARVLRAERERLDAILPRLFGFHLLQVGGWGRHAVLCGAARTQRHFVVDADGPGADVIADPEYWPITGDSVDVVVLPHTLEFVAEPHRVLREAERVLVGEGHLVVLGFDPWSAWGLWKALLRRRGIPWSGRFIGEARLRDWVALLGFELLEVHRHAYAPPMRIGRVADWFERAGRAGWPVPAGAYVLLARKRVYGMTPLVPDWKSSRRIAAGVAQPG